MCCVVADHVQNTPANVDYLSPARITLQPAQFNVSSPAVPPSGHAEVAPKVKVYKTKPNTEHLSYRLREVCAEFWKTVGDYESYTATSSNPSGMLQLGS